jgi:lipopolysaccharide export LptBFGC system permease protein LptF
MREYVEDLVPVEDYESLLRRVKWSEKLNVILFMTVLFVSFFSFVVIGFHTYQYENRIDRSLRQFKAEILSLTGDQNSAIYDLNQIVTDKKWITFQRLSAEQLQDFFEMIEDSRDLDDIYIANSPEKNKEGVGGK